MLDGKKLEQYDIRRPQMFVDHSPTIDTVGIVDRFMDYFSEALVKNEICTAEDVMTGKWLPNPEDVDDLRDLCKYQLDLVFASLGYHVRNPEKWEHQQNTPEYRL